MSHNSEISSEQDTENKVWWLAVTLNVFGGFINAYGWMLQKQTHNEQASAMINQKTESVSDKEMDEQSAEYNINDQSLTYLKRFKWWTGYVTYGFGSACVAASYGFGPASLLLPLESLVIVFNAILGAKFLDEHLYKKDWLGIALIIFGLIISVAVGPKGTSIGYTIEELELLFHQIDFLVFISIYTVITIVDWVFIKFNTFESDTFFMLSFNWISAYFGSWNVLVVKCIAEILVSSFSDLEIAKINFTHWLTYILMIIWTVTVVSLEYWRQKALAIYISTYVMSIYRVFIIVGGVLFGALYFNDFQYSNKLEIVLFVFSVCVAMCGVFIVATKVDDNDMLEDRKSIIQRPKRGKNGYCQAGINEVEATDEDQIEMENITKDDTKIASAQEETAIVV